MAVELSGRRIFIASPGDLSPERDQVRGAVSDFNERHGARQGVAFLPCGWESVVGTAKRPQDAINPLLRESDYAIFMLRSRWGTPPGGESGHTSGTEEEFHEAMRALSDTTSPMKDVLLIFFTVPSAQLSDPGSELKKVLSFKADVEAKHQLLYHSVDSQEELRQRVEAALQQWAASEYEKRPVDVLSALTADDAQLDTPSDDLSQQQLLDLAREMAASGSLVQAEVLYSRASRSNDPGVLLEYARFMRRVGRIERAAQLNLEVLESTAAATDPDSVAERASALANLGVIRRKQGNLRDSRQHLTEAAETARTAASHSTEALEYALDNLGITCLQQGDRDSAVAAMSEGLRLRSARGDRVGEAKSLVNVARVEIERDDLDTAGKHLAHATELLSDGADPGAFANALVAQGEIFLAGGQLDEADENFERALDLNRTAGNSDGIGIAYAMRARTAIEAGDLENAKLFTRLSHAESSASGNQMGELVVRELMSVIALAEDRPTDARVELERAMEVAQSLGQERIERVRAAIEALPSEATSTDTPSGPAT